MRKQICFLIAHFFILPLNVPEAEISSKLFERFDTSRFSAEIAIRVNILLIRRYMSKSIFYSRKLFGWLHFMDLLILAYTVYSNLISCLNAKALCLTYITAGIRMDLRRTLHAERYCRLFQNIILIKHEIGVISNQSTSYTYQ